MKRGLIPIALGMLAMMPAYADGDQATVTSTPSPIVSTKAFEVKIQTSDFGADVYCYTWAIIGSTEKEASDWAGSINPKFKMQGSGGTYTLKVADIQAFYNLTDGELEQLTRLGFIARTSDGRQTADCFAEVVQGRRNAYSGGEGTQESPFILTTADDLAALAATPADWESDVWMRLDADIALSSFAGIGSKGSPFKGHFDGNGHVVKGAVISGATLGGATGFFNAIDGATITRLGLTGAEVSGVTFTGALVGYAASGTISRCFTAGKVSATSICVGGLVGENHASISDCYSTATVTNVTDYVAGGLVGKNKGTVANCYASGKVAAYNYAGGLVGANYGNVATSTSFNPQVNISTGNYAGRFGGNDNPRNSTTMALGWSAMKMDLTATHGHNADGHSYRFIDKATYADVLGWDFDSVWEWKVEGKHQYPVLAGLAGQTDPGHNSFYEVETGIDIIDTDADALSVFPNPVGDILHVASAKGMTRIGLFNLNGAAAGAAQPRGAADAEIDCSSLESGIYLLDVAFSDGSHAVKKIIKK